jgi:signal transduction histidine kinase/CheY-like chemotaxis protein
MQTRNLRISTQLTIAILITLTLVSALGILAWQHSNRLWQTSHNLYNHSLEVRRAVGGLRADILIIHRAMKDILLTWDVGEQEQLLLEIAFIESDVERRFDRLDRTYTGDPADVDSARSLFEAWKQIRNGTLSLMHAGRHAEAVRRTFRDGVGGAQAERLYTALERISNFSERRSDMYYADARQRRDRLLVQLAGAVGIILILTSIVGYFLLRGISLPLSNLTSAAQRFSQGDYTTRSDYASRNEFGRLSAAFNTMAARLQEEMRIRDNSRHVKNAIITEEGLQTFSKALLTSLVKRTQSVFAAMYMKREQNDSFHLLAELGMSGATPPVFSLSRREGILGLPYETREVTRITDIPDDAFFMHSTPTGALRPREIIVIPVVSGETVLAMITLGSLNTFPSADLRLFDDIALFLGTRFSNILGNERIKEYAGKMEIQNRELEAQANELVRQADELSEQNIELAMQKQELSKANSMKSAFLSNMSHELRTPLNSVIALAGVLNRRLEGNIADQERGYIEIIERNGRHLLALINDILDLSRIEAGREDIVMAPTRVRDLVHEVGEMLLPQAQQKGLDLAIDSMHGLPDILSDAGKCRQILINIIGNAIKFTERGSVRVSADKGEKHIRISVTDTGIGIAPEHIDHIFEEFRQVEDGVARRHDGTGLGLAIARRYAEMLCGSIDVNSETGIGSTFVLTLPLQATRVTASKPHTMQRTTPALEGAGSPPRILVVEDSEAARLQLRDILEPVGYEVTFAENGAEAIARINESVPSAVILDLMMPEIDGFEVLRVIRSEERSKHVPVLILTALHVSREELAFLEGNNIHQFIQKGDVNKQELLKAVAAMVLPTEAPTAVADATAPYRHGNRPTVLVIEDNPDNLVTIRAILSEYCEVIEATSGPEGLERAVERIPDLILCDISLPGLDGFRVLEALRDNPRLSTIPVAALTARAMKSDMQEILARGFDAYLPKPVDARLLFHIIHNFVYGENTPDNTGH